MIKKEEISAALNTLKAVLDAIRELKEVPNGVLYSHMMWAMPLTTYNQIIGILKQTGLVSEQNNVLRWVEPAAKPVNA